MTRLTKWAATTALVLTAGFGLTACGDDADPGTDSETSKTSDGGGSSDGSTDDLMARVAEAQVDAGSSTMTMTMVAGGMEIVAQGQTVVAEDPADAAVAMTMSMPGLGDMEIRLVEGVLYMNMGAMTENKFVVVDTEQGPMAEQFGPMLGQMDPRRQIELFEEALVEIEQEGEAEQIDGVEATPYRLVLDTETIVSASGANEEDLQGVDLPETLEFIMFVGEDDLPRRIVMDMMGTASTIDFSGWGDDVEISAPGADEITDVDPFGMPAA